jgi:hypothetical protein
VTLLVLLPVDLMVARHAAVRAALVTVAGDTRAVLRTGGIAARIAGRDARSLVRVAAVSWMGRLACDAADTARDALARLEGHPTADMPCPRSGVETVHVFRVAAGHAEVREIRVVTIPAALPCVESSPARPAPVDDTRDGS